MKIFGREPAVVVALVGSILTFLAAPNLGFLSVGQAVAAIGVVTALVLAYTTRPVAPGLLTGAVVAIAGLAAEFSLNLADETVAAVSGVVLAMFAFITRGQVSPEDTVLTHH